MTKIKKIYKTIFIILFTVILLPAIGYFTLKLPSVQTWLGQKLIAKISKNIPGEVEFANMHFIFFNAIQIDDLIIRDSDNDTLLYTPAVNVGIRKTSKKERLVRLGRIDISQPVINIKPDSTGDLNLITFVNLLIREDTAKRNREMTIRRIRITDGKINYYSGNESVTTPGSVNFNNVSLNDLQLTVDNFDKLWKNVSLILSELSFKTESGFEIKSLFTELDFSNDHIYLHDPTIRTNNSFINSELIGVDIFHRDDDFIFFRDARLKLIFNSSLFYIDDLSYFIDDLKGFNNYVTLSGNFNGTVNELKGRDLNISYSDSTRLVCDFNLSGLPDIDNTFMFIDIEDFTTHTTEISALMIPGKGYLNLGDQVNRLGNISFNGNFTGFITDFVTYGLIQTDIGNLSTDILFKPDTSSSFVYKGSLKAQAINLGELTDREDILGVVSGSANVDGYSESLDNFRANLNGNIDSIQFNDYTYRDINLNGLFTEKAWDGSIITDNDNLKLDLLGRFDFTNSLPEVDFTLNIQNANLYALNIDPVDTTSDLSILLIANMTGDGLENLNGEVRLLNSKLTKFGNELELFDASLKSTITDDNHLIEFRTDYIDADLSGSYDLESILSDFKTILYAIAPSLSPDPAIKGITSLNNFKFEARFKNTDDINNFFRTGILIAPGSFVKGRFRPDSIVSLYSEGDYFTYNKNSLLRFSIAATSADSVATLSVLSDKLNLADRIDLHAFNIEASTNHDKSSFNLKWSKPGSDISTGEIFTESYLSKSSTDKPKLLVNVLPSTIMIGDKKWTIDKSSILVDSTSMTVNDFLISNANDFFRINGKVSENSEDTLHFGFNNLNLGVLNNINRQVIDKKERKIEFLVDGSLIGNVLITDVYNNLMFGSNISIRDFKTNEHEHGDVGILSNWDNITRAAAISIKNDNRGVNTFDVNGYYDPENKNLNLTTGLNSFPLDILNLVLHSFASDMEGHGTGKVSINGQPSNLVIEGGIMAEDASMTIDYLQTKFFFSDSIFFDRNRFVFDNINISDENGNTALLDGYVSHTMFKEFNVDLRIETESIKAMDTREKDNNLFYGIAYASGLITIRGPAKDLEFNISARTDRNTRMFIPLNSNEKVTDYSFISFIESDLTVSKERVISLPLKPAGNKRSIDLKLDLDVTPDAEIQLVFDSRMGDVMRGRGSGNLNLAITREGKFTIFGDYTIENGVYLLTLGNIFNKRFIVENGGTISWDGDITNAEVNIRAIYKLKASLYELIQDDAFRSRIPVECHLNMSGQLINPVISFDIYLPTADEETRTYLRNAINSDEEMSRQFLYLLVMNSFYPDPAFSTSSTTSNTSASAMGVTTTEMLSNQLSNWLSQISNDFDIGFTYRPENEISTQEVEVALSTQLLNDRVVINGNFDVGGQETTSSTNNITGEFDMEVRLTEKVRLKVFNRSNDNLYYETAPYTQGFGLFFRKDFNKFSDIFKKDKGKMKKEKEIRIEEGN